MVALGRVTASLVTRVRMPVVVAAWHWYSPMSLVWTPVIIRLHSLESWPCSTENLSSAVNVTRPLVRIR